MPAEHNRFGPCQHRQREGRDLKWSARVLDYVPPRTGQHRARDANRCADRGGRAPPSPPIPLPHEVPVQCHHRYRNQQADHQDQHLSRRRPRGNRAALLHRVDGVTVTHLRLGGAAVHRTPDPRHTSDVTNIKDKSFSGTLTWWACPAGTEVGIDVTLNPFCRISPANECGSLIPPRSGTLRLRVSTSTQSPCRDIRYQRSVACSDGHVVKPRQANTVSIAGGLSTTPAPELDGRGWEPRSPPFAFSHSSNCPPASASWRRSPAGSFRRWSRPSRSAASRRSRRAGYDQPPRRTPAPTHCGA